MTCRSAQGWKVCWASSCRIDGPDAICRKAQVVGERLLLSGYHYHNASLAHCLNDGYEVAIPRHQDRNLKESAEGANEHVYCNKAINTLLAPTATPKGSHLDLCVREQPDSLPVFLHGRVGEFIGAGVIKENTCQADRDVRGSRELFRGRALRGAPRLDQIGIGNVVSEQAWVCQWALELLA